MLRLVLFLLLASLSADLCAQDRPVEIGLSLGSAVPTLGMSDLYHLGPLAVASAEVGVSRTLGIRLDASASRNEGRLLVRPEQTTDWPDVWTASVLSHLVVQAKGRSYVLVGVAAHRQRLVDRSNPYGWVPGIQAGLGTEVSIGGVVLVPEIQGQVILSDLTSNGDATPSVRVPIAVGMRF